jgi:hypothetical protein
MTPVRRTSTLAAAVAIVSVGACSPFGGSGSNQKSSPTPSASSAAASSSPSPKELLFAVVEARGKNTKAPQVERDVDTSYDTVAIVGLDGFARTRQTFQARSIPKICGAASVLQLPAAVAAGGVYYVDGAGVVRRLAPDGSVSSVTTFPISSPQQELWFGVSPDATQLAASRLTLPTFSATSQSQCGNQKGTLTIDFLRAKAGQHDSLIRHVDLGNDFQGAFTIAGWDHSGPLALVQTAIGTQAPTNDSQLPGQSLTRFDMGSGTAEPGAIGGTSCHAFYELQDGTVLCGNFNAGFQVRNESGALLWQGHPPNSGPWGDALSPDGSRVAVSTFGFTGSPQTTSTVVGRDGTSVTLARNFIAQGWLDNQTLIGEVFTPASPGATGPPPTPDLGIVKLSNPTSFDDLGFKGAFVGVVQTP